MDGYLLIGGGKMKKRDDELDIKNMKIELKQEVPRQAPFYTSLYVNGIKVGEYIYGKDKKYLNPEKWARQCVRKRLKVITRNIDRLEGELKELKKEKDILMGRCL